MAIKTTGSYKGKSNKLGGGGRFKQMVDEMTAKGMKPEMAAAVAASEGQKKYGKKKMSAMATAGRKRTKK